MNENKKKFSAVNFCISWECGELSDDEVVEGFQQLINSGLAYNLQGCYGRFANDLINVGLCTPRV